jgi:hypothetical protein
MGRRVSALWPIGLLHPDGEADPRLLLGSARTLAFGPGAACPEGPVEAVAIAPTAVECREPAFFDQAVDLLANRLSGDGLGYVLAPRGWRRRLLRRLEGAHLVAGPAFAHFPSGSVAESMVPIGVRQLRAGLLEPPGGGRGVALEAVRHGLPRVGVVVRRAGARASLEWLGRSGVTAAQAVIRVRVGKKGARATLECLPQGTGSALIGKIALEGAAGETDAEAAAIERLGPAARRAGARVPVGTVVRTTAGHPLLLSDRLPGQPAARLLRGGSIGAREIIAILGAWLERWNGATRGTARITANRVGACLLEQAAPLAPALPSGAGYLQWIRVQAAMLADADVPLVAAHHDLTMVNVLLHGDLPPGIVDWEVADADGLPLADFWYAAVDATVASARGRSREEAFARCFLDHTPEAEAVRCWGERIRAASGLPAGLIPLCFHACWLQHAANEARTPPLGPERPFLGVLRTLAASPALGNVG